MAEALSAQEIATYRRDGFLVPRYRLPPADLTRLQALTSTLIADNPTLITQPIVCPHIPGSGAQGLKSEPGWMDFACHHDIVDLVSQLIGPDIVLWGTTLFYKPAHDGPQTPWHRDGRYWPIKPLETTSVWIAVSDSKIDNGCLRCIPGSHAARLLGRHQTDKRNDVILYETLAQDEFDETTARDVELAAGQMAIFDVYTIHGARHNRGTRPRAGFSLRFMPATSRYEHEAAERRDDPGNAHHLRPLLLVAGHDRAGNDFRRGHPSAAA